MGQSDLEQMSGDAAAPRGSRGSALTGGPAASADGFLSFPSLPAGTFHPLLLQQLLQLYNFIVVMVLATATVTPEVLPGVMGHSSPRGRQNNHGHAGVS